MTNLNSNMADFSKRVLQYMQTNGVSEKDARAEVSKEQNSQQNSSGQNSTCSNNDEGSWQMLDYNAVVNSYLVNNQAKQSSEGSTTYTFDKNNKSQYITVNGEKINVSSSCTGKNNIKVVVDKDGKIDIYNDGGTSINFGKATKDLNINLAESKNRINITAGKGNDIVTIEKGCIAGDINGNAGNDTIVNGGNVRNVNGGAGNDLTMNGENGKVCIGSINAGDGGDITVNLGEVSGSIYSGKGDDTTVNLGTAGDIANSSGTDVLIGNLGTNQRANSNLSKIYDKDGYDSDGYDQWGYNRAGYDKDGYDRDGNLKSELDFINENLAIVDKLLDDAVSAANITEAEIEAHFGDDTEAYLKYRYQLDEGAVGDYSDGWKLSYGKNSDGVFEESLYKELDDGTKIDITRQDGKITYVSYTNYEKEPNIRAEKTYTYDEKGNLLNTRYEYNQDADANGNELHIVCNPAESYYDFNKTENGVNTHSHGDDDESSYTHSIPLTSITGSDFGVYEETYETNEYGSKFTICTYNPETKEYRKTIEEFDNEGRTINKTEIQTNSSGKTTGTATANYTYENDKLISSKVEISKEDGYEYTEELIYEENTWPDGSPMVQSFSKTEKSPLCDDAGNKVCYAINNTYEEYCSSVDESGNSVRIVQNPSYTTTIEPIEADSTTVVTRKSRINEASKCLSTENTEIVQQLNNLYINAGLMTDSEFNESLDEIINSTEYKTAYIDNLLKFNSEAKQIIDDNQGTGFVDNLIDIGGSVYDTVSDWFTGDETSSTGGAVETIANATKINKEYKTNLESLKNAISNPDEFNKLYKEYFNGAEYDVENFARVNNYVSQTEVLSQVSDFTLIAEEGLYQSGKAAAALALGVATGGLGSSFALSSGAALTLNVGAQGALTFGFSLGEGKDVQTSVWDACKTMIYNLAGGAANLVGKSTSNFLTSKVGEAAMKNFLAKTLVKAGAFAVETTVDVALSYGLAKTFHSLSDYNDDTTFNQELQDSLYGSLLGSLSGKLSDSYRVQNRNSVKSLLDVKNKSELSIKNIKNGKALKATIPQKFIDMVKKEHPTFNDDMIIIHAQRLMIAEKTGTQWQNGPIDDFDRIVHNNFYATRAGISDRKASLKKVVHENDKHIPVKKRELSEDQLNILAEQYLEGSLVREDYIFEICDMIRAAEPLEEDYIVYRGISPREYDNLENHAFIESLKEGSIITRSDWTSTAPVYDSDVDQLYHPDRFSGKGYMMRIKLPAGTKGIDYRGINLFNGEQSEFLLAPNSQIKINKIDHVNQILECEYILPDKNNFLPNPENEMHIDKTWQVESYDGTGTITYPNRTISKTVNFNIRDMVENTTKTDITTNLDGSTTQVISTFDSKTRTKTATKIVVDKNGQEIFNKTVTAKW